MKIALIQFNASTNKEDNLRRSIQFVQEAASKKASWILLPENFLFRGNLQDLKTSQGISESVPGPTTQEFKKLADQLNVNILLGSILEESEFGKPYNTSVLIQSQTTLAIKYRKIHLFDAIVDGRIIKEEAVFDKGTYSESTDFNGFKIGLSICYDLRFPELYQKYSRQGANVLTVPSCFTKTTGKAHWECLLRARAIENLSYVLAPNQVGMDSKGIESYGHSMVVSPWGEIISQGSEKEEEIVFAEISMDAIKEARKKLPGIIK